MSMSLLYRQEILDHAQNPRNYGAVKHPHFQAEDSNVFCGDRIRITGTLTKQGKILEVRFEGEGCAISQAAASILTDYAKSRALADVAALTPERLVGLLGIPLSPIRIKCALLPLVVVQKAQREYSSGAPPTGVGGTSYFGGGAEPRTEGLRTNHSSTGRRRWPSGALGKA